MNYMKKNTVFYNLYSGFDCKVRAKILLIQINTESFFEMQEMYRKKKCSTILN